MTSLKWRLAIPALIMVLAGCGTTRPNNYYLLSAQVKHQPENQFPSLGIGPIEIPEYLNRNGLVYNRDGNKLHIANYERWAEPLSNGVERVLGLNLASLLDTEDVQSFPWSNTKPPDYSAQVTIVLMDANDTEATLIAEWVLQKPAMGKFLKRKITRLTHTMPEGQVSPEQIAPAYSDLLYRLSEIIAAAVSDDITAPEAP